MRPFLEIYNVSRVVGLKIQDLIAEVGWGPRWSSIVVQSFLDSELALINVAVLGL